MKNEVQTMRLIDAPVGLLEFNGTVILKTEYMTRREDGSVVPDCYIVESGEYFCGGVETAEELKNLEVTQVSLNSYGEHHFPDLTKMVPLTLEQLRKMERQPVLLVFDFELEPMIALIEYAKAADCIILTNNLGGRSEFYSDEELRESGIKVYAYPPAHIDREAWEPCEECEKKNCDNCLFSEYLSSMEPCNSCCNAKKWEPISRFCSECGLPLTEEAWAELEKRMWVTM